MRNISTIKTNKDIAVKMRYLSLNGQQIFESFKNLANQSQEQVNLKQKSMSKIIRIGLNYLILVN